MTGEQARSRMRRERDRDERGERATVYALASGTPPCAVAVVRVSGPGVRFVLETTAGGVPPLRRAVLRAIRDPRDGSIVDRGLVLFFPTPASFTGEDVAELQVHGSRAVVAALLDVLGGLPGLVPAEPGAFTRRALENGRLDLTAVEGLADLIAAETDLQRRQAQDLAAGSLTVRAEAWRAALLEARAAIEADLDFAEEEDVPASVADAAAGIAGRLVRDLDGVLADGRRGERIRDGFQVVLTGPPNAGKSSLINYLARRDVAIVTAVPGTTRDLVEVRLDLGGRPVVLTDTAGLRDAGDEVEREGMRRARARAFEADLVLWLSEDDSPPPPDLARGRPGGALVPIRTKADLGRPGRTTAGPADFPPAISVATGEGVDRLEAALSARAAAVLGREPAVVTRDRHRRLLEAMRDDLSSVTADLPAEIRAEALRSASDKIGRLTGRIDVEEVLGAIFSSFCIGK